MISSMPSTTWLLVRMWPSSSIMTPVPSPKGEAASFGASRSATILTTEGASILTTSVVGRSDTVWV